MIDNENNHQCDNCGVDITGRHSEIIVETDRTRLYAKDKPSFVVRSVAVTRGLPSGEYHFCSENCFIEYLTV